MCGNANAFAASGAFDIRSAPRRTEVFAGQVFGHAPSISSRFTAPSWNYSSRCVLKSDNPKTLAQIDAIFVTVEPNGGSVHPSGKPLLFAYLRVQPNHP